jgi:phage tail-like protein
MNELFTVIQGTGTGIAGQDFRSNMDIKVLAHPVTRGTVPVKAAFRVYNAWPTSVAYSDLDAGANAIVIQQMTLAHEGFTPKLANGVAASESVKF